MDQLKFSAGSAIVLGSVAVASFSLGMSNHYYKRTKELKADNFELLKKTVKIVELVDTTRVPEEILTDIQFRCMAVLTEADFKNK